MAKQIVSFALEPEVIAQIKQAVAKAQARGDETNFSAWLRDAVRAKLKANAPIFQSADYLKVAEKPDRSPPPSPQDNKRAE